MLSVSDLGQNHQSDSPSSANEIYFTEAKPQAPETYSRVGNNFSNAEASLPGRQTTICAYAQRHSSTFSILEHIDRLQPAKGSNRYICPVCGGNDLTIEPKTGKYQCWHGCECSSIREAVSPWKDLASTKNKNGFYPHKKTSDPAPPTGARERASKPRSKPKKPILPVSLPKGKITLATLPFATTDNPRIIKKPPIPQWATEKYKIPQDCDREIIYQYSKTQWISRYEWSVTNHPKGRRKHPHPKHLDDKGNSKWNKGKNPWQAYKIDEAIANCQDKWVAALEGEPCVETARTLQLAAITWQGGSWTHEEIAESVTKLKNNGASGLVVLPDNDQPGTKKGLLILSVCSQLNFPCLVIEPTDLWSDMPPKGDIVDWVQNCESSMNQDEFIARIELAIHRAVDRRGEQMSALTGDDAEVDKFSRIPHWSQSDLANWLAERYRPQLAWNTELQEWCRYGAQTKGIWSIEPVEFIGRVIKSEIESVADLYAQFNGEDNRPKYSISLINGIMALLKLDLAVRRWDEATGLLPLLNGVLDLNTKKLIPHAPGHRLTWCLPYAYNPLQKCDPILDWLRDTCGSDRNLVQLMRAYLYGVVTGRTDWQKYLELIGAGGTGKSTFTRLAIALVGANNTHTTTLKKLEGERFETASIAGKRLVLINDSERYAGSVSTLKALTGQDTLPYEVKFKQSTGGFTPEAMVIVAANETIQSSDYTSGLERRRITVPMFNKISSENQRNLIEHRNGEIWGEFAQYIPGLLNWVLEIDESEATKIIRNYQKAVPKLAVMKAITLVETNPIADWLDNNIVYRENYRTNIGVANRDKDSSSDCWYLNTDKWLYANYAEYCHSTGTKSIGLRRFGNLLSDLCKNQLELNIEKGRDRNGSYFSGLKIRDRLDNDPPIITGKLSPPDINPSPHQTTNTTSNTVTDVMNSVTDSVTDESTGGDKCDGCDGYFESQSEELNSEKLNSNDITAINDENLPSHPSHNATQSIDCDESEPIPNPSQQPSPTVTPSVTNHHSQTSEFCGSAKSYGVTRQSDVIKPGSRVNIINCPGHCLWAQPFKVLSVKNGMAELEMFEKLVTIDQLEQIWLE